MLETMKRNKILTYAFLMAFPMTVGSIFSSCTDDFEKLNTSNIQVNPADLPFAAQCTEPMTYCYPPQQNMFQFWTNLTIDLYGGYFMTPNGNFTNGDMGENRGHSGGMYENYYLHIFNNTRRIIAQCDASGERGLSGVMRIVQAYGTLMTTDAYGPIPYSSILSGENEVYFEFDSQKDLYKAMLEDLSTAITDISAMGADEIAKLKSFDCWCNGDKDLWVKIANTMKLRMALRLSKRETEASNAGMNLKAIATEAAQNTLATVNKDILIDKSLENEMWLMFNWGDCGFNANLVTIMSGTKDPRQPLYMTLNTGDIKNEAGTTTVAANSQYLGIRFASGLPAKPNSWGSFSGWIQGNNGSSYSMPLPIMKAAEAYFLFRRLIVQRSRILLRIVPPQIGIDDIAVGGYGRGAYYIRDLGSGIVFERIRVEDKTVVGQHDRLLENGIFGIRAILPVGGRQFVLSIHYSSAVKIVPDIDLLVVVQTVGIEGYIPVNHPNIFPQAGQLRVSVIEQDIAVNEQGISLLHPDIAERIEHIFFIVEIEAVAIHEHTVATETDISLEYQVFPILPPHQGIGIYQLDPTRVGTDLRGLAHFRGVGLNNSAAIGRYRTLSPDG